MKSKLVFGILFSLLFFFGTKGANAVAIKNHGTSSQQKIGDPIHSPSTIIANFLNVVEGGLLEENTTIATTTSVAARPLPNFLNVHASRMHSFIHSHFHRFLTLPERIFGKIFQTLHILFRSILI